MMTGPGIAERRRQLDMTQDHLAGAACVSRSTVQRAERGLPVSAESLRSIRAVLDLDPAPSNGETVAAPYTPVDPAGGPPRRSDPWSWYADAVIAAPIVLLTALAIWLTQEIDTCIKALLPGLDGGTVNFAVFLGELALSLTAACFTGRLLWRRTFHPQADRLVIGMGPAKAKDHRWAGGTVVLRLVPLPVLRWSQGSRAVRTWPGAMAMALLLMPATLALHIHPIYFVGGWYTGLGYGDLLDVVPAWSINPESPLAKAGLQLGDRIRRIDGNPVLDHIDLALPIRDAYHRTLSIEVARYHRQPGEETKAETLILEVPVADFPNMYGCPGPAHCAWIGDQTGLLAIGRRDRSLRETLIRFGREIANVIGIIAHPKRWEIAWYRDQPDAMVPFFLWMAFRFTVCVAGLFLALGALALNLGIRAWPRARGMAARIPRAARRGQSSIMRYIGPGGSMRSTPSFTKAASLTRGWRSTGTIPVRGLSAGSLG